MNLVLMGPQMNAQRSAEAAALVRAHAEEQIGPLAFRLRGVDLEVAAEGTLAVYAGMHGLDHAWVPEGRRFADLRLIAMDMDSTLITIECIDEIGDAIGIKDRIAEITAQAMRGEIDYPESLRRRVAMLAGLDVGALANVYHQKLRLSPGAEILVDAAKRRGIRLLLVSGGFTYFTDRLKDRLGLDHTASNVLEIEAGRLTGRVIGDIVDAQGKAARLRSLAQSMGLAREQVLAIGDGANDLAMMAEAGVSVAYRAKPVVKARATHALDHMGLDGVLHLYE